MNLILGIEIGDGLQDGLEGTKCFGWPLRKIDDSYGTPKSPINPASLLDHY